MSSQQVARRMMLDIGDKPQEHLVAIYLDTQNRIIQQKTVFIGGVRRSIAEPREILHYACHLMPIALGAIIMIIGGVFPAIGYVLTTIPQAVLGG